MELNIFIKELEVSLVKQGIHPDVANKHVHTLQRTFTDDDLNEIDNIQSTDEVEEIAVNIAAILTKNKIRTQQQNAKPAQSAQAEQSAKYNQSVQRYQNAKSNQPVQSNQSAKGNQPQSVPSQYNSYQRNLNKPAQRTDNQTKQYNPQVYNEDEVDSFFEEFDRDDKTTKGFYTFWLVFIATLPITLILAGVFFGLFAAAFIGLSALIAGLIAGLIGLVAVGAGVSLVGIIFGITQLFTFFSAGLYEIGLGIMVIGIVMFAGILIYNIAVRFLPWVIKKVAALLKFSCGKIRDLFLHLRRECYRI